MWPNTGGPHFIRTRLIRNCMRSIQGILFLWCYSVVHLVLLVRIKCELPVSSFCTYPRLCGRVCRRGLGRSASACWAGWATRGSSGSARPCCSAAPASSSSSAGVGRRHCKHNAPTSCALKASTPSPRPSPASAVSSAVQLFYNWSFFVSPLCERLTKCSLVGIANDTVAYLLR